MIRLLFLSSMTSLGFYLFADPLSQENQDALNKATQMLENREKREAYIEDNPSGKKADSMAKRLMGDGEDLEQIYKLSADIMRSLAQETDGDPSQMMKVIQQLKENPEALFDKLTPEQQQRIRKMGYTIENKAQPDPQP